MDNRLKPHADITNGCSYEAVRLRNFFKFLRRHKCTSNGKSVHITVPWLLYVS